jgi:hypothetical protein
MIETDGAIRKSSTGKWKKVEEGECGPQKDCGLVTTKGGGSTFSKEAKHRFP